MILALAAIRVMMQFVFDAPLIAISTYLFNLLPGTVAVAAAVHLNLQSTRIVRLDKLAGDLSYPIYICHWAVAVLITWLIQNVSGVILDRGPVLLMLSMLPIFGLSYLCVAFVDSPIAALRSSVRTSAKSAPVQR